MTPADWARELRRDIERALARNNARQVFLDETEELAERAFDAQERAIRRELE